MAHAILKISCPDTQGIVYHVSKFIFDHQCNILSSQQHLEDDNQQFLMRIEFDVDKMNCTRKDLRDDFKELEKRFDLRIELNFSDQKKRMALMVSKYDHCLYDLLLRHQYGELNCDVALIVSNHNNLENVAQNFKIPYFYIPISKETKQEGESKTIELFRQHQIDFVVLARYMQVLSPTLLKEYPNKIINVHHGFLPAFKGAKPYHQAYEKGVKLIGATSHYANEELDMGPIIEQETVRVDHSHDAKDMVCMGRDIEKQVLSSAVKAHLEDRIFLHKNKTIVFKAL